MAIVRPLRPEDIHRAQALMAETWSDLLKEQTGLEMQYPVRPARWYEARISHEPSGTLCLEEGGEIIGTGFCLSCGSIGWIGPMEIIPGHQGRKQGKLLLQALEKHLDSVGCTTIGLETMKDIVRNISFYVGNGYRVEQDVLYLEKTEVRANDVSDQDFGKADMSEIRRLADTVISGYDPSKEFTMYESTGTGVTFHGEGVAALLVPDIIPGSGKAYLRTLLTEGSERSNEAIELVKSAENEALRHGASSIFTIMPAKSELLHPLLRGGYRPKGVDIRMMKGEIARKHECSIISWSG
ncbi:MAG: GNAT family N-acetyltransferase [Methanomassiliicoccales archaeon]|nr:GNAT family N-acetyltransferase [Methanomassiliicoccales archaeon]